MSAGTSVVGPGSAGSITARTPERQRENLFHTVIRSPGCRGAHGPHASLAKKMHHSGDATGDTKRSLGERTTAKKTAEAADSQNDPHVADPARYTLAVEILQKWDRELACHSEPLFERRNVDVNRFSCFRL